MTKSCFNCANKEEIYNNGEENIVVCEINRYRENIYPREAEAVAERCIAYKEDHEQTNEEWFVTLSTEEKATYIFWKMIGFDMYDDDRVSARATSAMKEVVDNGGSRGSQCYAGIKAIESWLKEVHKEGE